MQQVKLGASGLLLVAGVATVSVLALAAGYRGLVLESFDPVFLSKHHKKFVDVPVGDCKVSHLHMYPHLQRSSLEAPTIKFVQSNEEDLCVSNSLASALFNIGFRKQAEEIVKFGQREVAGGTVDALEKVVNFASKILPPWLQMKRKPME